MGNNKKEILIDFLLAILLSVTIFITKLLLGVGDGTIYVVYVIVSIIFYVLIIKSLSHSYKKRYSQIDLIGDIGYRQGNVIFNHYLLPIQLLVVLPWYLYFGDHYRSILIVGLLSFLIYLLYFINLRAYFKNNYKLEHKTHFIYDLLNILCYLFFLYVLLSFVNYFGISRQIGIVYLVITEIFFYFVCFNRYFVRIIKKLLIISILLITFNIAIIILFNFPFLKIIILTIGSYINFIIFSRKYLQQEYKLDKQDYFESLLIQAFSLGFAFII